MTVINTNYSNLEDVWGSDFEKPHKKKASKPVIDPLCNLYAKRNAKLDKKKKYSLPLNDEYLHRYSLFNEKNTQEDEMYYGYEDDQFNRLVNDKRRKKAELLIDAEEELEAKCLDLNFKKEKKQKNKVHFNIEPEDEDDEYLQNAIQQESDEESTNLNDKFEKIYSNVYEETDDENDYNEENDDNDENCTNTTVYQEKIIEYKNPIESEDTVLINKELLQRNKNLQKELLLNLNNSNEINDERHYLDLMIYILSGIILIFMMEQFIQIGMRIKNPYL